MHLLDLDQETQAGELPHFWTDLENAKKKQAHRDEAHHLRNGEEVQGMHNDSSFSSATVNSNLTNRPNIRQILPINQPTPFYDGPEYCGCQKGAAVSGGSLQRCHSGGTGTSVMYDERTSISNGVVLPTTLSMEQGSLARTHIVLDNLLSLKHTGMSKTETFVQIMIDREQDI